MKNYTVRTLALSATLASAMFAQNNQRQAAIVGGGSPDRGKCTLEVVVDSVAQVEIRGTSATLRTLSGQPAQWRRFQCTSPMPVNAPNFRFTGVDGRGRQELLRDPRNGGVAIVQIEDKDGGAEGYTFDVEWDTRGPIESRGPVQGGPPPMDRGGPPPPMDRDRGGPPPMDRGGRGPDSYDRDRAEGQYRPNYRDSDYYRRYGHGFGTDEAVRVCEQSILTQATRRFRTNDIHFRRTSIDDNPGRQDFVMGAIDVHRPRMANEEVYGFSCSVDFESGRVRTADLELRPRGIDRR